jgi:hypothetical protein
MQRALLSHNSKSTTIRTGVPFFVASGRVPFGQAVRVELGLRDGGPFSQLEKGQSFDKTARNRTVGDRAPPCDYPLLVALFVFVEVPPPVV